MIRLPQAFLLSLFLHLLIGAVLFVAVIPKIGVYPTKTQERCLIALAHVLPAFPPQAIEHDKLHQKKKRIRTEAKLAIPEQKKTQVQAHEPVSKPVKTFKSETIRAQIPSPAAPKVIKHQPAKKQTAVASAADRIHPETPQPLRAAQEPQSGERYLNEHLARIAQLLQEYLYYPRMARKRHIEGEVFAVFTLEQDGSIHDISIKKHARSILDRAALQTIESLSGRMPHPEHTLTLEVPIRFVLK